MILLAHAAAFATQSSPLRPGKLHQNYAWDGIRFRLAQMTEMNECRGSVDFTRTWTARVPR